MLLLLLSFLRLHCFVYAIIFMQLDFSLFLSDATALAAPADVWIPVLNSVLAYRNTRCSPRCSSCLSCCAQTSSGVSPGFFPALPDSWAPAFMRLYQFSQPNLGIMAGLFQVDTGYGCYRCVSATYWQAEERPGLEIFLSAWVLQADSW